jgi:hypothetical protein
MTSLTPEELDKGERLLAEADKSLPWIQGEDDTWSVLGWLVRHGDLIEDYGEVCRVNEDAQLAALIVYAVNHLPALLKAARERDVLRRGECHCCGGLAFPSICSSCEAGEHYPACKP